MPKRTRAQQDLHNARRRIVKQEGRKAIVCMKYMKAKYENIYEEVCEFFDKVDQRYPGKRDLTKTYEFYKLKDQPKTTTTTTMLEPHLKIPLMPNNTVTIEEIPPVISFQDAEIEKIIKELRQDPDLASVFNDFELPPASDYTIMETSTGESIQEEEISSLDQEIDQIIQGLQQDQELSSIFNDTEFNAVGEDLPDISDDETFW